MRLIDADNLVKHIENKVDMQDVYSPLHIIQFIHREPTVEPETKVVANVTFNKEQLEELVEKAKADILAQIKRPQGEWIDIGNTGACNFCSVCKEFVLSTHLNFCPNCGALMKKGGAE